MYSSKSGYPEVFQICAAQAEKEQKACEVLEERIESLTLGFEVCEITGFSKPTAGYPELHMPVCEHVVAAMVEDLEEAKRKMRQALPVVHAKAIVLAFK